MILSKDQTLALQQMETFVSGDTRFMTLQGYAGTGKTFVMKEFVEYLDSQDIPFVLCAPTHKAKLVLKESTGYDTITLHSLLGMSPNIEIFELDYRDLKFLSKGLTQVPYRGVIIIDESSMINSELYKLLQDVCRDTNSKVIFVGDLAQLQPVGDDTVSPVFKSNFNVQLTKIHRQNENNGLLNVLKYLRNRPIKIFEEIPSSEGSLFVYDQAREFILDSIPHFKHMIKNQNVLETKLLAYTNDRVNALNKCLRRVLFRSKDDFINKGEILTGYSNFEYNESQIYNSLDYIVTSNPIKVDKKIPYYVKLPGYDVQLYDTVYDSVFNVFILDPNINIDYINSLCQLIEGLRMDAIQAKNCGNKTLSKNIWKKYFQIVNSFASFSPLMWDNREVKKKVFDYGYATTVHKA